MRKKQQMRNADGSAEELKFDTSDSALLKP